jgi:hypothetical protein
MRNRLKELGLKVEFMLLGAVSLVGLALSLHSCAG